MNFLVYMVFMITGMTVAAFFGWMFMRWVWSKDRFEENKGVLAAAIAAILAMLGASR